jgi:hypothetical protein
LASIFSPTGDLGDLLLPRVDTSVGLHQLQVVDDDQRQTLLLLQPPGLGPDLHQRDRRGVVDEQRRVGEGAERITELAPVGVLEPAGAQPRRVDPRLGGEQPVHDLQLGHLQAEQHGRLAEACRGEVADGQRQAALSHRRSGGEDDQVLRLQPGGQAVQIVEPGRQPGDLRAALGQRLDLLEGLVQELTQSLVLADRGGLGDLEDQRLRSVDDRAGVVGRLVAERVTAVPASMSRRSRALSRTMRA